MRITKELLADIMHVMNETLGQENALGGWVDEDNQVAILVITDPKRNSVIATALATSMLAAATCKNLADLQVAIQPKPPEGTVM